MKPLLLAPLLLTLLVASCSTKKKYNSYRQANDACKEWASKDGYYIQRYPAYTDNGYNFRENDLHLGGFLIDFPILYRILLNFLGYKPTLYKLIELVAILIGNGF